eukprot:s100_g32.t1
MYRKSGASVLVEKGNREEPRDVFQFVCGMCWQYFIELEDMASKVGVVFLLYLLFHTQYHSRFAIPVTIDLLQQLTALRDQCVAQEIFLELPAILREMVQKDLFSVGLRATCRSLWFDRHGHLIERQVARARTCRPTLVTIQRPPDLTDLQKQEYEEINEKAEVIPKSDPSSSDQVKFMAAATQRYVNSVDPGELPEGGAVPLIEIEENENAEKKTLARFGFYHFSEFSIPSQIWGVTQNRVIFWAILGGSFHRKRKNRFPRRRVIEDPEDNDVDQAASAQTIMEQRKEVVCGKAMDVWRKSVAQKPQLQCLGLDAASGGMAKRLVSTVEQTLAQALVEQNLVAAEDEAARAPLEEQHELPQEAAAESAPPLAAKASDVRQNLDPCEKPPVG